MASFKSDDRFHFTNFKMGDKIVCAHKVDWLIDFFLNLLRLMQKDNKVIFLFLFNFIG